MYRILLIIAIVIYSIAGFSKIVQNKDGSTTYVPQIIVKKVPEEQILVRPKPDDVDPNQIGVGCDTLRGKGLGVIILKDRVIQFVIDCPEQPRRDT